jgi:hypothetical protein
LKESATVLHKFAEASDPDTIFNQRKQHRIE